MAGLHVPLPTLRLHPRGCRRTARGRCGSLFLTSRWTFTTNSSPVLSRRTLFFGEYPLGAKNPLRWKHSTRNWQRIDIVYLNPDQIETKGESKDTAEITLKKAA
jgi:hypothetical protein